MVWKASKNEVFSVRSFYNALEDKGEVTFPSKIIWDSWAPTKVSFFSWEVTWDRILSIDQLKKRGWVLAGFRCTCKDADESVEHLLIHCGQLESYDTFSSSSLAFRGFFLFLLRICWRDSTVALWVGKKRLVWRTTPLCLLWIIWKEQNQRTFEGEQHTIQALKSSLITNLYIWSQGFILGDGQESLTSLLDFIEWSGSSF